MNHHDYMHHAVPINAAAAGPTAWHPAIDAHCLIAGGAADERATLISSIAADCAAAGWSVQQGDSILKQQEIITDMWVLMEQRYDQNMADPSARDQWDPVLLVVDEEYGGIYRTATMKSMVQDLVALARSAKIHVLVCASSPPVSLLSGDLRDSIAVRVPVDDATRTHQLMKV